jgi:hypothetical protein
MAITSQFTSWRYQSLTIVNRLYTSHILIMHLYLLQKILTLVDLLLTYFFECKSLTICQKATITTRRFNS